MDTLSKETTNIKLYKGQFKKKTTWAINEKRNNFAPEFEVNIDKMTIIPKVIYGFNKNMCLDIYGNLIHSS